MVFVKVYGLSETLKHPSLADDCILESLARMGVPKEKVVIFYLVHRSSYGKGVLVEVKNFRMSVDASVAHRESEVVSSKMQELFGMPVVVSFS